jgi:hypothetical protein
VVFSVLLTAPYIPAGMTGIRRNPPEWDRNDLIPAGMGLESTGMDIFLQEWIYSCRNAHRNFKLHILIDIY